ncbi:Uncharacterised protein [Bordetella pertussis]|nr:Uncharacterised protein [Bordetella pertussis]
MPAALVVQRDAETALQAVALIVFDAGAESVVEAVEAGRCVRQLRLRDQGQPLPQSEGLARFDTQPIAMRFPAILELAGQP